MAPVMPGNGTVIRVAAPTSRAIHSYSLSEALLREWRVTGSPGIATARASNNLPRRGNYVTSASHGLLTSVLQP